MMFRYMDDMLVNIVGFIVNSVQTLVNVIKIPYVQISLLFFIVSHHILCNSSSAGVVHKSVC